MLKRVVLSLSVLLASGATAVLASGAVYIPVESSFAGDRTEIRVVNPEPEAGEWAVYWIGFRKSGTERDSDQPPETHSLPPKNTVRIVPPPGFRGLAELTISDGLTAGARLVSVDGLEPGAEPPVISSDNAGEKDEWLHLPGWERGAQGLRTTNFRLANLSHGTSECRVRVFEANGTQLFGDFVFQITPLTVLPFSDAPAALNKVEAEDMRASVTCDAPFYAWATVTDGSARQAVFVTPARGNSTLQPPGSEASCSPAADICFERAGLFHRPVPGDPEEKMLLPVPPGEYRSIRVSFDAMNGGPLGYRGTRYVEQLMFWLAVRGDRQRYGFVRLRNIGPDYELNVSHGVGTRFEDKIVHRTGLFFPFGAVYHWDYLYDAENRSLILTVTDQAGNTVARVEGIPNVDRITRPEGWDFHLNFGYGKRPNDNEYRSLGWEFSNLVVEVYE